MLKTPASNVGYPYLSMCKDGVEKKATVHRLVAEAFVDNDDPVNKTEVDHINRVRTDSRAVNLRWVSHEENSHNRSKRAGTSSMYKGVYWNKQTNWRARI